MSLPLFPYLLPYSSTEFVTRISSLSEGHSGQEGVLGPAFHFGNNKFGVLTWAKPSPPANLDWPVFCLFVCLLVFCFLIWSDWCYTPREMQAKIGDLNATGNGVIVHVSVSQVQR